MKQIINGIRYDTMKAKEIGQSNNLMTGADSTTDFKYWEATLFVTPRSRRYFLAGRGGPHSMFSHPYGQNGSQAGEGIIPLEADEALEWAEQNLPMEVVEEHFAEMIKDA